MSQVGNGELGPKGFGGWLILPMIGLVVSPFRMGFQFFTELAPLFQGEVWRTLTDATLPGHKPGLVPIIIFEAVANVAMFAFTLALIWFFFRKSRRTPRLYIVWLILLAVVQVVDAMLVSGAGFPVDKDSLRDIIRSILTAAVWIPYFLVSKRVANTFVEPAARDGGADHI